MPHEAMNSDVNTYFQEALKRWLPYPPAYLLLLATVSLVGYLFVSPETALKLIQIEPTQEIITKIKWQASPWLLLLGITVAHFLIVSHLSSYNQKSKNEIVTLAVGEYFDVNMQGDYNIRIHLKAVSLENTPATYEIIGGKTEHLIQSETATLSFSPSQMYGGRRVRKLEDHNSFSEETFVLPKNQNIEAEESVFFFHVKNAKKEAIFFKCSIDHINMETKKAEINIYRCIASK
jgi:hypothetical protein